MRTNEQGSNAAGGEGVRMEELQRSRERSSLNAEDDIPAMEVGSAGGSTFRNSRSEVLMEGPEAGFLEKTESQKGQKS